MSCVSNRSMPMPNNVLDGSGSFTQGDGPCRSSCGPARHDHTEHCDSGPSPSFNRGGSSGRAWRRTRRGIRYWCRLLRLALRNDRRRRTDKLRLGRNDPCRRIREDECDSRLEGSRNVRSLRRRSGRRCGSACEVGEGHSLVVHAQRRQVGRASVSSGRWRHDPVLRAGVGRP